MFTKDDVGERPGKKPFTEAEKQAIADEWNANAAKQAEPKPLTLEQRVAALEVTVAALVKG